jgi:organic hydroperoxide reductase OsmC/OhrA
VRPCAKTEFLDLAVQYPKALGGANDDFAVEMLLFAAGYAACFDSALNLVIKKKIQLVKQA